MTVNIKKPNTIFVIVIVIFLLLFFKTTNAFCAEITELNEEYPNADSLINSNSYKYYLCMNLDTVDGTKRRYILFFNSILYLENTPYGVNADGSVKSDFTLYFDSDTYVSKYKYSSGTWTNYHNQSWVSDEPFFIGTDNYTFSYDNIDYCNFDIKTKNGTVVFSAARYLPITIVGQISSNNILRIVRTTLSGIPVLVIGLVVLVVAFQKAWEMLKTTLCRG